MCCGQRWRAMRRRRRRGVARALRFVRAPGGRHACLRRHAAAVGALPAAEGTVVAAPPGVACQCRGSRASPWSRQRAARTGGADAGRSAPVVSRPRRCSCTAREHGPACRKRHGGRPGAGRQHCGPCRGPQGRQRERLACRSGGAAELAARGPAARRAPRVGGRGPRGDERRWPAASRLHGRQRSAVVAVGGRGRRGSRARGAPRRRLAALRGRHRRAGGPRLRRGAGLPGGGLQGLGRRGGRAARAGPRPLEPAAILRTPAAGGGGRCPRRRRGGGRRRRRPGVALAAQGQRPGARGAAVGGAALPAGPACRQPRAPRRAAADGRGGLVLGGHGLRRAGGGVGLRDRQGGPPQHAAGRLRARLVVGLSGVRREGPHVCACAQAP
mmetsp:Transcript_55184/g.173054  ORF Transcript_55184/g.173054 Transcript_55184/m.173054 type:complete len:385 (-) Transcript_55184:17-1171(-)